MRLPRLACGALLFAILALPGCGGSGGANQQSSGLAAGGWPKFQHDAVNTGEGPALAGTGLSERWTAPSYDLHSPPIVGPDNTVYVSDGQAVTALDGLSGTAKWTSTEVTGGSMLYGAALGRAGDLYVGGDRLYCLNASTGAVRWSFAPPLSVSTHVTIGPDGTVYFGTATQVPGSSGSFYALDGATGAVKWQFDSGDVPSNTCPAIDQRGILYTAGMAHHRLFAISSATGREVWHKDLAAFASPAVGPDGTVYVPVADPNWSLLALNGPTGATRWHVELGHALYYLAPAVANGRIYICGADNQFVALSASTGAVLWSYPVDGSMDRLSASVTGDGRVLFGTAAGTLTMLDGASGALLGSWSVGTPITTSIAIGPSAVYFAGADQRVHCYGAPD